MAEVLRQLCQPRKSVFDPSVRDTVYSIDDLKTIDAREFFAENYVTEGMKQLLCEVFSRLEGKNQNASGAYLLSQSMGGGKTHNLIALGLLARHPQLRQQVMGSFYEPGPLGSVRVAAFSGRRNTEYGIWGEIAAQLKQPELFNRLYSPLRAPGDDDWVNLLEGQPTLVMLDELPPYFNNALAIEIGSTTLADITTTALANLLVAVSSGKLPNACVVMTDLSGRSYAMGSERLNSVLGDLESEANRTVQRIAPVRLNSPEFYGILRTRLFEDLPGEREIESVADAYAKVLDEAKRLDLTTASPQQMRADILRSYPFHPGLQDLYARFRENQGFQQTRALIRIMRLVVARLWKTGEANQLSLIGAHDLDFHDSAIINEINQINRTLENAIAHDIATEGGGSVAEAIDAGTGSRATNAQDVARLIFMSSLSTATNPTFGLTRSEIFQYLAAPQRDLSTLGKALDTFQTEAWYLHATHDGRLFFRNTENLNAKLESYARGISREDRERGLRERLAQLFEPVTRDVYQTVEALPALDEVKLSLDQTTLIIVRPDTNVQGEIEKFWESQQFKNRVLFITSRPREYQPILDLMGYLRAIDLIIAEFEQQGIRDVDLQLHDAREMKTKYESRLYMAFREAFQTVLYPTRDRLSTAELKPQYTGNRYEGEAHIRQALIEAHQFVDARPDDDSFRTKVENRLWNEGVKEMSWPALKRRAAQDSAWVLHHPRALDDLREAMTRRDLWRDLGNDFIQRGPFPKPAPSVQVQLLSRDDQTGKARLRITPLHATSVRFAEDGSATEHSPELEGREIETDALTVSFLPIDTETGQTAPEPIVWTNAIEVKYDIFSTGEGRYCELKAIPRGEIRYTDDGTSPLTSGKLYTEPFPVRDEAHFILAVAQADGISTKVEQFNIPAVDEGDKFVLDPVRPAQWNHCFQKDSTGETFAFLETLAKHEAKLAGIRLTGEREAHYWEFTTDPNSAQPVDEVRRITDLMLELFPERNVTLVLDGLHFERGQDLLDLAAELRADLRPNEVKQAQ